MNNRFKDEVNVVQINSKAYQIQSVKFEDKRFFFVKNNLEEVVCMILCETIKMNGSLIVMLTMSYSKNL
jgi:hypothetical protein